MDFPVETFKQEGKEMLSGDIIEEVMVTLLCDKQIQKENVDIFYQYICDHHYG